MKKQELIQFNAMLYHVADYVNERFEDASVDTEGLVDEDPGFASPRDIHRTKQRHKDTAFRLTGYIAEELEGKPHELEDAESFFEGDELEAYYEAGSLRFYDGSRHVFSHDVRKSENMREEVLEELIEGRNIEEVKDEVYDISESAAKMRNDFQGIVDNEGYLEEDYAADIELFMRLKRRNSPLAE